MAALNKVILIGRLTQDPENKVTPNGNPVATFTVAVDRKYTKGTEKTADFINCVAWRDTAGFVTQHFGKGSGISVVGSIQTRNWKDKDGKTRYATEVIADEVGFIDKKAEGTTQTTPLKIPAAYQPTTPQGFAPVGDDDNLPF